MNCETSLIQDNNSQVCVHYVISKFFNEFVIKNFEEFLIKLVNQYTMRKYEILTLYVTC